MVSHCCVASGCGILLRRISAEKPPSAKSSQYHSVLSLALYYCSLPLQRLFLLEANMSITVQLSRYRKYISFQLQPMTAQMSLFPVSCKVKFPIASQFWEPLFPSFLDGWLCTLGVGRTLLSASLGFLELKVLFFFNFIF